jgi:hypothetical protein
MLLMIIAVVALSVTCASSEVTDMLGLINRALDKALQKMEPGEKQELLVNNTAKAEIIVLTSAYMPKDIIRSKAEAVGLSSDLVAPIYLFSNSQDGIYFFAIKADKIIIKGMLNNSVSIEPHFLAQKIKKKDVVFKVEKKASDWRPLVITNLSAR